MIKELKKLQKEKHIFEIIQSNCAYERYSDNSGNGIEGISLVGVGNDKLSLNICNKEVKHITES